MDELREGYKNIKGIGWIPQEWEIKKLGDIIDKLETGVSVNSEEREKRENEFGILKTSSVSYGIFMPQYHKTILTKEIDRAKLNPKKDSIIISRMNTPELVGASVYIPKDYNDLFLPDRLWQTTIKKDIDINVKCLYYILNSDKVKYKLSNIATGTSNSMKNISKSAFLNIKIPFFSFPEQQKIAQIISTWDKAINKIEALIEEKKIIKKGLMQQLLTGRKRLKGFEMLDKTTKRLKNYLQECTTRNKADKVKRVLSVTNSRGFIEQSEQFDRTIASANLSEYKIVKNGEFGYNPSRINVGSIDLLRTFDEGLLSPMYIVFKTIEDKLLSEYLYQYFKSRNFYEYMKNYLQGSVRQNLTFKSLCQMKVFIPSLDEQRAITNILTTADKEIVLLEEKLEILKQQKKVLMQNLLTGKVRVTV
ncbi:restriction endonuclease subunit S [Clostridium botulinum]|nr:restriction endonuclease subunit S [Clostridium botulinum]